MKGKSYYKGDDEEKVEWFIYPPKDSKKTIDL